MITLTNVLTLEKWDMPDAISAQPFYLSYPPWPPGDYNVRNGSGNSLVLVYDSMLTVVVPPGVVWSVSTNENLYSWYPVAVDFAAWTSRLRGGQGWMGWAPVNQMKNI